MPFQVQDRVRRSIRFLYSTSERLRHTDLRNPPENKSLKVKKRPRL
jgi:hypothetical protein